MAGIHNSGSLRYRVVDVFTRQALQGNPLAVFPDAAGIDGETMQKIANELNLSETAFVLPATLAGCAARVRIFTPRKELPFAGHPTIGASFVLVDEGMVAKDSPNFALQEEIGPVPMRVESGDPPLIWLKTPPIVFGEIYDPVECAKALGLAPADILGVPPQLVSAGNPTVFVALRSAEAVDRAWLDSSGMATFKNGSSEPICVFVFAASAAGAYSRMFAPEHGIPEDPATGSATGPLAALMMRHGLAAGADGTRFISEQGVKMGRRSVLHVQIHGEQGTRGIEVGGHVAPLVEASMKL